MTSISLVLLALLAQSSSPASNLQDKAKAKGLLSEGSALYKKGDYASALAKFEAAYAAYPSPKLWFNIGQANRDLGRPVEAVDAFEKFLTLAADASPDTNEAARSSVTELRKELGQLRIECETPDAEISIDGKSVGRTPLPKAILVTPGRHQVTAVHTGTASAVESTEVGAGGIRTVVVLLVSNLPPPPTPLPPPTPAVASSTPPALDLSKKPEPTRPDGPTTAQPFYKTWWFWTGASAVVVAGTVSAIVLSRHSSGPCDGASLACRGVN